MKGKLKKAIKETFLFPETAHKEEFFRQVEGGSVSKKEYRCITPLLLRFTAAAAAAAVSLGVWGSMKFNPVTDKRDYNNGTVIETTEYSENTLPSVTTANSNGSTITVTTVHNDGSVYIETTVNNSGENPIVTTAVNNGNVLTVTTANNGGSTAVTTAEAVHNESGGQITAVITSSPNTEKITLPAVTDSGAVPVETTVSAVQGTKTPQSEGTLPSISTPIYVPTPDINGERSYYMKKFASFTTAVTILASSSGINAFAEYQPPEIQDDVQAVIDYIDSTNPNLDFNFDGNFDALDIYSFYKYVSRWITDEMAAKCAQNGDINKDGIIDFDDFEALDNYAAEIGAEADTELDFTCDGYYFTFDYFTLYDYIYMKTFYSENEIGRILENGDVNSDGKVGIADLKYMRAYYVLKGYVKPEELKESHYKIEGIPGINSEQSMVNGLKSDMSSYDMGYRIITDKVKNGEMSLDLNCDGKTNILDAYDYYCYNRSKSLHDSYEKYESNGEGILSEELWESCKYFDSVRPDGADSVGAGIRPDYYAVIKYFLYNTEITEDVMSTDMYEKHCKNYYTLGFVNELKLMASNEGIVAPDENVINDDLFWQYYDVCEAEFNSGERALPDVDLNGVIDYEDYYTSVIFFMEKLEDTACEDSILPADVWNNFSVNCDYNGNGVSGDVYDTSIVQIYVLKYGVKEPENFEETYQEYVKRLSDEKGIATDYETSVQTGASYSLSTSYDRSYDLLCSTDIERSGDANNDNEVNIADAVAIAKVYTYPEKYQLTSKGRFNADIYNTGDGVTAEDGEAMQKQLLGK